MKIEKTLERLRDRELLEQAARDIGHELPRRRLDVLSDFRARAADLPDEDEYTQGYRAALLDLVAAYERAVEPAVELDVAAEQVLRRENDRRVLEHLARAPALPHELAGALGVDRSTVTRVLQRLRMFHLAEELPSRFGDGRHRLHRLTEQGETLHDRLQRRLPPVVKRAVGLAAAFFGRLIAEGRVTLPAIERSARALGEEAGVEASVLARELVTEAARLGLVRKVEASVCVRTDLAADSPVSRMLDRAIAAAPRLPGFLEALVAQLPRETCLYVRSASYDRWRVLLELLELPFQVATALEPADRWMTPAPLDAGATVLLYDSVPLLRTERSIEDETTENVRALDRIAVRRFCLVSDGVEVPAPYEAISISEPESLSEAA